jgi:hypothetical protein
MWGTIFCLGFLSLAALLVQMMMLALLAFTPDHARARDGPGVRSQVVRGLGQSPDGRGAVDETDVRIGARDHAGDQQARSRLSMSSLGFLLAFIATARVLVGPDRDIAGRLHKHAGGQANAHAQQRI